MPLLLLLALSQILTAQSLEISNSAAGRGETGSFLIRLEAPPRIAPVSLQWDLSVSGQVVVKVSDVVPGSSAEAAGKTIACVAAPENRGESRFRCILAGGSQPLRSGPVAIVKYAIPSRARPGGIPVRLEKEVGVSNDLRRIDFPKGE